MTVPSCSVVVTWSPWSVTSAISCAEPVVGAADGALDQNPGQLTP